MWVSQEMQRAACSPTWVLAAPYSIRVLTGQLQGVLPWNTRGNTRQAVPGVVYSWTGLFDNPVSSAGSKRNVIVAVLLQDYRSPWATKPGWLVHSPALPSPQEGVGVLRKFSGDWVWDVVAESSLAPEQE